MAKFSTNPEQVIAKYPGLNTGLKQEITNKLLRQYNSAVLFYLFRTRPGFTLGNPTEYAIHAVGEETIKNLESLKRRATLSVINPENCQPINPEFEVIFDLYAEGFVEPDFLEASFKIILGNMGAFRYLISKGAPPPKPGNRIPNLEQKFKRSGTHG